MANPDRKGTETSGGGAFPFLQESVGGVLLRVKVVPKAKRVSVVGVIADALKVSLTAPADRGEANRQLQEFLAETLGLSPASITLKAGFASRNKVLLLAGVNKEQLLQRLRPMLG